MRLRRARAAVPPLFLCLAAAASVAVPGVASGAPAAARQGSAGGGDPYFPRQGNGGYQVRYYSLRINYDPGTRRLVGRAGVHASNPVALSRFDLDLRRTMTVSAVFVNGQRAAFRQPAKLVQELVITPKHVLPAHHRFTVGVRYAGKATSTTDPDGSLDGFIPTGDGAFVAGEPQGAPTWYPVNDTPRDKATYRVAITVPHHVAAISNGRLVSRRGNAKTATWTWKLNRPVSSYLVTASIGRFKVTSGRTRSGTGYVEAVDPREASASKVLKQLPAIVDFFSSKYGRYPFQQTGAIVDHAHFVGYALEVATRPLFDRAPDLATLSHELAHEWFGDTVTLRQWRDIWLNEGFAEFSSWLYDEHVGGMTGRQHLAAVLAHPASDSGYWNPPPGNPGANDEIFAGSVYDRGAATLQALREKLGGRVFFRIMHGWFVAHRYGNARVPQFTAYAQRVSHVALSPFFHRWLYEPGKP